MARVCSLVHHGSVRARSDDPSRRLKRDMTLLTCRRIGMPHEVEEVQGWIDGLPEKEEGGE